MILHCVRLWHDQCAKYNFCCLMRTSPNHWIKFPTQSNKVYLNFSHNTFETNLNQYTVFDFRVFMQYRVPSPKCPFFPLPLEAGDKRNQQPLMINNQKLATNNRQTPPPGQPAQLPPLPPPPTMTKNCINRKQNNITGYLNNSWTLQQYKKITLQKYDNITTYNK